MKFDLSEERFIFQTSDVFYSLGNRTTFFGSIWILFCENTFESLIFIFFQKWINCQILGKNKLMASGRA